VPPQGKLDTVLNYIREHPGCRSTEIIAHTSYPKTTLDRCLSDLKRQELIEYRGSKKTGGYCVVGDSMERTAAETAQGQGKIAGKKVLKEKSAKKKLTEGKPAEPSSKE
jgi:predicted transcriptional regulator